MMYCLPTVAAKATFFCPHPHSCIGFEQKWDAREKKRKRKTKAHLLILWGSFSDDMTITGIGLRGLIA